MVVIPNLWMTLVTVGFCVSCIKVVEIFIKFNGIADDQLTDKDLETMKAKYWIPFLYYSTVIITSVVFKGLIM